MKLNHTAADFSRRTPAELIEFHRRTAMLLWRRAPHRPTKAARLLTLRPAQCLAGLLAPWKRIQIGVRARTTEKHPPLRGNASPRSRDLEHIQPEGHIGAL